MTTDGIPIAYSALVRGTPVVSASGRVFGVVEHVLEIPAEDLFDGIVVWPGAGGWLDRRIQRDLSRGEASAARRLELLQPHHLRFVDADQVAAITTGYIRCDLDEAQATALPPPAQDAPLYYANAIDQAMYGTLFRRRGRWSRGN